MAAIMKNPTADSGRRDSNSIRQIEKTGDILSREERMSPVFTGVFGYEQATERPGNICLAICCSVFDCDGNCSKIKGPHIKYIIEVSDI